MVDKIETKRYQWDPILTSETTTVTYPSGSKTSWMKVEDLCFPINEIGHGYVADPRDALPKLRKMKARPDDILICSYPRSVKPFPRAFTEGQHLTFEIITMLMNGNAEYSKIDKDSTHFELHYPEEYDNFPSPRIFNTHTGVQHIPKDLISQKCKIVYVVRNPKDVAVSNFNLITKSGLVPLGNWEDFLHTFDSNVQLFRSWYTFVLEWEKFMVDNPEYPIHLLHFEHLKQNTIDELRKLGNFLGLEYDDNFLKEISSKVTFDKMKAAKIQIRTDDLKSKDWDKKIVELQTSFMYRKGEIGDWKNWFTVAQNEHFDEIYERQMKNSTLSFVYE